MKMLIIGELFNGIDFRIFLGGKNLGTSFDSSSVYFLIRKYWVALTVLACVAIKSVFTTGIN